MKKGFLVFALVLLFAVFSVACGKQDSSDDGNGSVDFEEDAYANNDYDSSYEGEFSVKGLEDYKLESLGLSSLYRAKDLNTELWGVVDVDNNEFTIPCEYDCIAELTPQMFEYTGCATLWVQKGEKWGAIDAWDGKQIYDFEFDRISQPLLTAETLYLAMDEDYFFQDASIYDGKYFQNEHCYVQAVSKDGNYGVVDCKGNVLVPCEYWLVSYVAGRIVPIHYTRDALYHTMFDLEGNQLFELRGVRDNYSSAAVYSDGYIYVVDQYRRGFAYRRDGSCASDESYGKDTIIVMPD